MMELISLKDLNEQLNEQIDLDLIQKFCIDNEIFNYNHIFDVEAFNNKIEIAMKIFNGYIIILDEDKILVIRYKLNELIKLINLKTFL